MLFIFNLLQHVENIKQATTEPRLIIGMVYNNYFLLSLLYLYNKESMILFSFYICIIY